MQFFSLFVFIFDLNADRVAGNVQVPGSDMALGYMSAIATTTTSVWINR